MMIISIITSCPPLLLLRPRPAAAEDLRVEHDRVKSPAITPRPLAIVITATSRWATWEISWARTASISGSSRRRSSPVVAHTTAALGLRPVANAVGHVGPGDGHAGLGHVGQRAEAVDHAVQPREPPAG